MPFRNSKNLVTLGRDEVEGYPSCSITFDSGVERPSHFLDRSEAVEGASLVSTLDSHVVRAIILAIFLFTWAAISFAQQTGGNGVPSGLGTGATASAGAPSGNCSSTQTAVDTTTGNYYSCNNGAWQKVGPGAGGAPSGTAGGSLAGSYPNPVLAPQAANTLLGNNTGSSAAPAALTISQVAALLGLGTAASQPSSAFDASGAASAAQAASLQKTNSLSDLASVAAARANLGLGSAATQPSNAFDAAGAGSSAQAASLQKTSNLSDLASPSTARTNLGLGTAATQASGAFDPAGAASTAQANAIAASAPSACANGGYACSVSPSLTGTPTAPTQPISTNNTDIATTAAVTAALAGLGSGGGGTVSGQAAGVIPLGTSGTAIGAQSHLDDGITAPGTVTSSETTAVNIASPNYSATQSYSYLQSTVGACDPQGLFNDYQFRAFWTAAGVFCGSGPINYPGAAYNQTAGVMGFAFAPGAGIGTGRPRAVGGYFQASMIGDNSSAFGINPGAGDVASTFTGAISGTTLTVSSIISGPQNTPGNFVGIVVGQTLFGAGITGSPQIAAFVSGTGGAGSYTITNPNSVTISSETISSQFMNELLPTQENDTEVYGALSNFANNGATVSSLQLDLYNFGPGGIAGPAMYVSAANESGSTGPAYWLDFAKVNTGSICSGCNVLDVNPFSNATSTAGYSSPALFHTFSSYWTGNGAGFDGFTGLQAVSSGGTNPAWDELLTVHDSGGNGAGPSGQAHYFTIGNSMAYAIQHSDSATNVSSMDIIAPSSATGGPITYTLPGINGTLVVSGANSSITSITGLTTPLTVAQGGIGIATAAANTVFGNFTGGSAAPGFGAAPVFSAAALTNFPTFNQNTTGSAGTVPWTGVTGGGANTVATATSTAAPWTFNAAGAASTPMVSVTGSWYTGGSSTTNWGALTIAPAANAFTGLSAGGTALLIGNPSGGTGNAIDVHAFNGGSVFSVNAGTGVVAGSSSASFNGGVSAAGNVIAQTNFPVNFQTVNTSAATSSTCSVSGALQLIGRYWTGTANAINTISLTPTCVAGTNGTETLTAADSGSSGQFTFAVTGNESVTGTETAANETVTSLTSAGIVTNTAAGVLGTSTSLPNGVTNGLSAAVTSATGGSGTGTITCATATCTNLRGTYTVAGGTFTTGSILTLVWPTTTIAYACRSSMINNATGASIGTNSVATATGMAFTSLTSSSGLTVLIEYQCQP